MSLRWHDLIMFWKKRYFQPTEDFNKGNCLSGIMMIIFFMKSLGFLFCRPFVSLSSWSDFCQIGSNERCSAARTQIVIEHWAVRTLLHSRQGDHHYHHIEQCAHFYTWLALSTSLEDRHLWTQTYHQHLRVVSYDITKAIVITITLSTAHTPVWHCITEPLYHSH